MEDYERQEMAVYEPLNGVKRAGVAIGVWGGAIGSLAFLALIAYALWLVHGWVGWLWLGYGIFGAVCILLLCLVAVPVILVARLANKTDVFHIGQHGIVLRNLFGGVRAYGPMSPGEPRVEGAKKINTFPMISFMDMIEQGIVSRYATQAVLGYDAKTGELVMKERAGGTTAFAGKGRSGKSRRVIMEVCQDLLAGATMTVIDPHPGKKDSLSRLLAPLAPWIRFATTEDEMVAASQEYMEEMERRVAGRSQENMGDRYMPRVIVFDEWSRCNSSSYSEEAVSLFQETIQRSSQEYAGVDGSAKIIGQDWTADACGGTAIRRAILEAFVHNISTEYAAFLIKARKWHMKSEELPQRNALYKNYSSQVRELITPHMHDDVAQRVAALLREFRPEPKELAEHAESVPEERYQEGRKLLSPSPSPANDEEFEHENITEGETVKEVNALHERVKAGEIITLGGESFTTQINQPAAYISPEEEAALFSVYAGLQQAGETITRSRLRDEMHWTNKQWDKIKAFSDRYHI